VCLQVCVRVGQMKLLQNITGGQPAFTVTAEPPAIALNRMGELYSGVQNKVSVLLHGLYSPYSLFCNRNLTPCFN
jgi:hypothetical protein